MYPLRIPAQFKRWGKSILETYPGTRAIWIVREYGRMFHLQIECPVAQEMPDYLDMVEDWVRLVREQYAAQIAEYKKGMASGKIVPIRGTNGP